MLAQGRPDLVLLDLGLPDQPGDALCTRLKQDSRWARVLVVLTSGECQAEIAARAREVGADGVLQKPFSLATLRDLVITPRC